MTLTKRIIPCLDVKGGRVVKGFKFESIKDAGDPAELARRYSDEGADELVFLDITASDERRKTIKELVNKVASVIDIPFTVGGGVTSMEDARNILLSGADKVGINTGAVQNPSVVTDMMNLFGRQCVVVAIDAKRNYGSGFTICGTSNLDLAAIDAKRNYGSGGDDDDCISDTTVHDSNNTTIFTDGDGHRFWFEVRTFGGKRCTGLDAISWAKTAMRLGAGEILLTSIDQDGTKDGYDTILTKAVVDAVSIPVIASGGCGHPSDMADVFEATDVDAALAASIFHYKAHGVSTTKKLLRERGISVRL